MNSNQKTDWGDRVLKTWGGKMGCGALLLLFAVLGYARYSGRADQPVERPAVRTHSDRLFDLGGTWAVVAIPGVAGVGMLLWGVAQLARGYEPGSAAPTSTRLGTQAGASQAERPAGGEGHWALNGLRFVYEVFWKPVFGLFGVANAAAAVGLLHLCWDEPGFYANVVAILVGIAAGYVELELLAQRLGWCEQPIFDWRERSMWLLVIGYALCVVLSLGLSINEVQGRAQSKVKEEEKQREREQWNKAVNSPDSRRAMEAMERLRPAGRQ